MHAQFQVTFVSCTQKMFYSVLFCCFIGTRVPDTQADNLSADTLECSTTQPSGLPAGDSGPGAEVRLPPGGRKDEHPRR